MLTLLLLAACGDPALAVLGDWTVATTYTIQQLDFDQAVVDEQVFEAADAGTMAFAEGAPPSGYGEYTFTRTLTQAVDRSGLASDTRFVESEGTEVVVGFDPMPADDGDVPTLMIYDSADEWNGEFTVEAGPAISHTIRTDYSATQAQLEIFHFALTPA